MDRWHHPVREFPEDRWGQWDPAEADRADRVAGKGEDREMADKAVEGRTADSRQRRMAGVLR